MTTSSIPDKPSKCTINRRNIPEELKEIKQWSLWKYHWNKTKHTKLPIRPSGKAAKCNEPATWTTFDECWSHRAVGDGINFAAGNGIGFIDLDDCVDFETGVNAPHVECMLRSFEHSYCEYSPSSEGIRIFFHIDENAPCIDDQLAGFEFYASKHFGSVTGNALIPGVKLAEIDYETVQAAYAEFFGGKVRKESPKAEHVERDQDEDLDKLAADVLRALDGLHISRSNSRKDWFCVLCALKDGEDRGCEGMLEAWHVFSKRCDEKYDEAECTRDWDKFKLKPPGERIGVGSLFHWEGEDSTEEPFVVHSEPDEPSYDEPPSRLIYTPIPVETLPSQLRGFVTDFSSSARCPREYVALPAMTACAAMIGNAYRIRFTQTWVQPSGLWTCCVGRPGSNKSAGFKEAHRCVGEVQRPLFDERVAEIAAWKASQAKKGDKSSEPQPLPLKLVVGDATTEVLSQRFLAHRRGLLQMVEELSGWFASHDQYRSGGKGSDAAKFISMYDAGILEVDRVGSGKSLDEKSLIVPLALMSISGTIQPDTLRSSLGERHLENGLGLRFLYTHPPEVPGDELPRYSHFSSAGLVELLRDLHSLPFTGTPIECAPDDEAGELFLAYRKELRAARRYVYEGPVAAMLDKHQGVTLRLILILHVLESYRDGVSPIITAPTVERAIELSRWCCQENERVLRAVVGDKIDRSRERLLDLIRGKFGGSVTPRDLMSHNRKRWPSSAKAEAAIDALECEGWGSWCMNTETGGRPSRRFVLY